MGLGGAALAGIPHGLSRSLFSCSSVVVTNVGLSTSSMPSSPSSTSGILSQSNASALDLGGTYVASGDENYGRPVYDEIDQGNTLYWTTGIEASSDSMAGDLRMGRPKSHPSLGGVNGILAACDSGGWMLRAKDGSYPIFVVFDCAGHPADVTSQDWFAINCRDCSTESVDGAFTVECSPESTTTDVDDDGDDDDGLVIIYTPSPSPPPFTNSPAVRIRKTTATIAPGATFELEDIVVSESTCDTVDVSNADTEGDYSATGNPTSGRYMYMHSSGAILEWISMYRRRLLRSQETLREEKNTRGDPLGREPSPHAALRDGSAGEEGRLLSREASARTKGLHDAWRRLADAGAAAIPAFVGVKDVQETLEYCSSGAWVLSGPDGGYPYIYAYDCATHPADVETTWYDIEDVYASSEVREDQVIIICPGVTDSSSSPGARQAILQGNDNDEVEEGSGTVDGVTEEDGGSSASGVLEGLVASGILLGVLGLCVCGVAIIFVHRNGKRAERDRDRVVSTPNPVPRAPLGVRHQPSGGIVATDGRRIGSKAATTAPVQDYVVEGARPPVSVPPRSGGDRDNTSAQVMTKACPVVVPAGGAVITGTALGSARVQAAPADVVGEESTLSSPSKASVPVVSGGAGGLDIDVDLEVDEEGGCSESGDAIAADISSVRSEDATHNDAEGASPNSHAGLGGP